MTIREITFEDYDMLVPFWKENYFVNEHDSQERFKLFLEKNPGLSILAEEDGEIIGSALGSFDGRRGYIQKLVVRKDQRRKGLGKKLMENIIKKLRSAGVSYIPLGIEAEYVSFYEKCGLKKTKQVSMNIDI
ncbi:MAG: GNAT family N-acetyltransferase [Candidatus Levybacteria bacterium]|nr:GNAT family N-acetyltransferase [Candidatus Levybacteria bacterium]